MIIYCPNCGKANDDDSLYCVNCKSEFRKIENQQIKQTNNSTNFNQLSESYYNPSINNQKNKKKKLMIIASIAISIILISAGFYIFFINPNDEQSEIELMINNIGSKIDGAPTASLQSLASGNLPTIPDENCLAKYYLYDDSEKIGEIIEGNVGIETYNGINCYKILGRSTVASEFGGQDVDFQMDYTFYCEVDTYLPVYMSIVYDYTKPEILKEAEFTVKINWDQNSGEINTVTNLLGQTSTTTSIVPTDYWGMVSDASDLYTGYNAEVNYEISTSEIDSNIDMKMQINIVDIEDVNVPSGTFENCYVLEIEQSQSGLFRYNGLDSTTKIWITEDSKYPQAQFTMSAGGIPIDMTSKLEGYYNINQ